MDPSCPSSATEITRKSVSLELSEAPASHLTGEITQAQQLAPQLPCHPVARCATEGPDLLGLPGQGAVGILHRQGQDVAKPFGVDAILPQRREEQNDLLILSMLIFSGENR